MVTVNTELNVVLGTGALGLAVIRQLLSEKKQVRVVSRRIPSEDLKGVEVITADLNNSSKVARVCQGADVVYHCACPPYTEWLEQFPSLMKSIIDGVAATDAKLIFGDNLYAYGKVEGKIDEDCPDRAGGRKGKTRALVARQLMQAHEEGRIKVAIGRSSNFYGPHVVDSVVGKGVFAAALEGKPAQILGDPDLPHTYTYIDDFALGLTILGARDEALGKVWHIPSDRTLTTRQFLEIIYGQLNQPVEYQIAPKLGIAFLSLFNPTMREVKEMLYEFEHPFIMDSSKFENAFGASFTSHSTAIEKTLKWYERDFLKAQEI